METLTRHYRTARSVVRSSLCRLHYFATITFVLAASPPACPQDSRSDADVRPQIVPWVESTQSRKSIKIDELVGGLRTWSKITDTAIVSTSPGGESLYAVLLERVAGITIIPGVKTKDLLPRFDSVEGWRAVARHVALVSKLAGDKRVALENETAFKPYINGEYEIDLGRFRRALGQLPADVEIIWYPSMVGGTTQTQRRAEVVCEVVADVLQERVTFTDLSINGPKAVQNGWAKKGRRTLDRIADKPLIPILYCYGPGSRWWMDEELPGALKHVQGGRVILYPGGKRWPQAARSITRLLSDSERPARP